VLIESRSCFELASRFYIKPLSIYQSSFCPPFIAFCLAFSASARPPARPPEAGPFWLDGVAEPLLPLAYPLSLGGVSSPGLRPTGRFAGGAGGVGFALAAPFAPGVDLTAAGAGGGGGREAAGGGGGGACLTSSRYAAGAQPEAEWSRRFASHHPVTLLVLTDRVYICAMHTIVLLLCDNNDFVFP
jgi:hypothetical protein